MIKHLEYRIGEPRVKIVFEDESYEILRSGHSIGGSAFYLDGVHFTDDGKLKFILKHYRNGYSKRSVLGVSEFVKKVLELRETLTIDYDENS